MADLAGCFLCVEKVGFYGRSMRVVAHAALLEAGRVVSMDLGKIVTLMAVETAAFEGKAAAPVQAVALSALHTGNRRMLVKRLKNRGRIRTHKEMHFLFAALPQQNQRVLAGGRLQCGVKHIRKGLLGLDGYTVKLKFSRWRGGNQVDLPGGEG